MHRNGIPANRARAPSARSWSQRIAGLARGRMQLEGGYSYLRGSLGDAHWQQHAVPDMLLRYGLTQRLELRLGWPGYVSSRADFAVTGSSSGMLDPNVGFLYDLWPENGWVPQTAVLAAVPLTWEGNPFALDSLQPLAELMYSWQIGSGTAVTGRSGLALFDAAGDNYTQFQQSVSVDTILTDRWSGFASWDMVTNIGSVDDSSEHMGGVGLSWLLTERLAISSRVAMGLNSAAPDLLFDLRFAYRF